MEHSILHALLLTGLITALGGPIAVLWLILPADRAFGANAGGERFTDSLLLCAARWTCYGAIAAALATFIDFFVQVAELKGQTVFGGADPAIVIKFATVTIVGRFCLTRMVLLILTAGSTFIRGRRHWWLVAALAWSSVIASSFVSHAAAQPQHRAVAITAQILHISAAALWMGVLVHLFVVRKLLFSEETPARVAYIAEMVRRFSPVALVMTSLLGITGLLAASRYLWQVGAIFTSAYGITLMVKLALLLPAIYAGFINFKFIRPRLLEIATGGNGGPSAIGGVLSWFSRTLELEVTSGLMVVAVAGILASVSPPAEDGSQRLTSAQTQLLLQPHLPNTDIRGWNLPDDPRGYVDKDMRWAMFTHNWSGIAVCLMALGWLAQSMRGRIGLWGARLSPFLLIPFGLFIGFAGDPELWLLHQVDRWTALTNPILLEHQIGAAILFFIAWLTWRDRKNPEEKRPLGYPLPIVVIIGSLMLLGHAHAITSIPDDLSNLINVEHAIFGAFGIFAGVTRLLQLRGLLPKTAATCAAYAWPCFILGWGLFMAFFYREFV